MVAEVPAPAKAKGAVREKSLKPVKPAKQTAARKPTRTPARRAAKPVGRRTTAVRKAARKGARRKPAKALPPKAPAPRFVKVRELDPFEMCGPGTSVARLFRVDERVNGSASSHLVFYDRHGWYCEHGRTCPAVHDVRKLGKHTRTDYNNGRMRA